MAIVQRNFAMHHSGGKYSITIIKIALSGGFNVAGVIAHHRALTAECKVRQMPFPKHFHLVIFGDKDAAGILIIFF